MPQPTVVGCLLDVSGSMRGTLETEGGDSRAVERLRAVIRAAVQLARAEQRHEPDALLFVGIFGLNTEKGCPASIDLCSAIEGVLAGLAGADGQSGHELLIRLANSQDRSYISRFIQTKLTEHEARIIYSYLQRHRSAIDEFTAAIPSSGAASFGMDIVQGVADSTRFIGFNAPSAMLDNHVENSDAMNIAHRICKEWLNDYGAFKPRRIESVIRLLETMDAHMDGTQNRSQRASLLDDLRGYMYGNTPMRNSIDKTRQVFRSHAASDQRILVLISDGCSTDGDPGPLANQLRNDGIIVATIFLTNESSQARKELYDRPAGNWADGQRVLFQMASRVHGATHPIPVLASMGWKIPSSGECGLYTAVCSTDALEEFCSMLLLARFGSADILFDMLERLNHDSYINDEHVRVCRNPSDQGNEGVCYAHATAAVAHMALLRIVDRQGGCPTIQTIRGRILDAYPPRDGGQPTARVLEDVANWYRPLRFREVDEDGARQAVLRRRPVLTTFRLTRAGWGAFGRHFHRRMDDSTLIGTLTLADMQQHRVGDDGGGHAVVLTGCDPQSLTFLNSWGQNWGNHGSFSVESSRVLERESPGGTRIPARFYDVYWLESDLTPAERAAYNQRADAAVQNHAAQHPSVFAMEVQCPLCHAASPIASFNGSIRRATCPRCRGSFAPEPGYLVRALYTRAGLGETT